MKFEGKEVTSMSVALEPFEIERIAAIMRARGMREEPHTFMMIFRTSLALGLSFSEDTNKLLGYVEPIAKVEELPAE